MSSPFSLPVKMIMGSGLDGERGLVLSCGPRFAGFLMARES